MANPKKILCLAVLLCHLAPAAACFALPSVTVMADSSTSVAIAEIARNYSRDRHIAVNASFAPPRLQETQIAEGASVDILITPREAWIEQLRTQGLIDIHSPTVIARNQLALVGPAASTLEARLKKGFPTAAIIRQIGGEPGFVVGNPETLMAGTYGKEALRKLGVEGELEPYTLYPKQEDEMLDMIARQQAYGILFSSAAAGHPTLRVIDLFPQEDYSPIRYFAVVIAGDNMGEARKFLEYLKTADVRRVFKKDGFVED